MPEQLLIWLDATHRAQGTAQLAGGDVLEFSGAGELFDELQLPDEYTLVVGGARYDDPAVLDVAAVLPSEPQAVWHVIDVSYALGFSEPAGLAELVGWAKDATQRLSEIPADVLAQLASLIGEAGGQGRLNWLLAELHRRFDALNMPAEGEVDAAHYYPLEEEAAQPSRHDVPTDLLATVFAAREALGRVFENYEERPQQQQMAAAVDSTLSEGRQLVVEAGTGVGKSLAYLIPLAIHAVSTGSLNLVSTNTINLQQQLVELDIPRLNELLPELPLRVTLLKGREHYLCIKRLEETWLKNSQGARQRREAHLGLDETALLLACRLLIQCALSPELDLDTIPAPAGLTQAERTRLLRGVDCGFATCLNDRCQYKSNCHFFLRRNSAMASHLVITNHALVFALHSPGDSEADNIVTRASSIVFDEAHNLEGAITDQHTLEVGHLMPVDLGNRLLGVLQQEMVRRRLELPPGSVGESGRELLGLIQAAAPEVPAWIQLGVEVREQVNALLVQAAEKGRVSAEFQSQLSPATAEAGQEQLLELLGTLARQRLLPVLTKYHQLTQALLKLLGDEESDLYVDDDGLQMELRALDVDLVECRVALSRWDPADAGAITWFNTSLNLGDPAWDYKTAPLDVGEIYQSLASSVDSLVLTSATLTVAGQFDYLLKSLGYDEDNNALLDTVCLDSPFNYDEQAMLLIADNLARPTGPSRDEYLTQLEDVIAGVADIFQRGVLILFNSYRDLNHIYDALPGRVAEERILAQGISGSRAQIADKFRHDGDKLLLATRSFWEGFDVAGQALSCVVLAKLPFANFKDPIHAGRQRAIEARQGDAFREYSLPLAAMQFKQGFGRLIRSTADVGCVFLLDSRVAHANYGKVFLSSLPGPRTVVGGYQMCLEEAREFMERSDD